MAEPPPDLGTMPPPWVCAGCKPSGLCSPLFFPLFGVPKHGPLNNREGRCAMALGGHHFNDKHNNQMKMAFTLQWMLGRTHCRGRACGGCCLFTQSGKFNNNKRQKLKCIVALDSRRLIFLLNNQPNTCGHDGGDVGEEDPTEGGCTGGWNHCFGGH